MHDVDYETIPIDYKTVKKITKRNLDAVVKMRAFDKDLTLYLEEIDHVLFGSNTPMYLSKLETTDKNDSQKTIAYDQVYFVRNFETTNPKLYH